MKKSLRTYGFLGVLMGVSLLASGAGAASSVEIPVDSSTPVYRNVERRIPHRECWNEEQRVRVSCGRSGAGADRTSIGLDTIIGAGIGAGIGNLVDNRTGADTGKAVGGLLGAFFANQARTGSYGYDDQVCYERRVRERCETRYDTSVEDSIVGYKNCARFGGEELCLESKRPLRYLRVGIVGSR